MPDKWAAKQLWDQELEGTFYASAVCDKGLIYAVANEYKFTILDARDGKILAARDFDFSISTGRLANAEAANMYPSITLAENHLFVFNDQDDALVLEPANNTASLSATNWARATAVCPSSTANASTCAADRTCIASERSNHDDAISVCVHQMKV